MSSDHGILQAGARRVWQHQRVLWWFFTVNFVLAFLAARPVSTRLAGALDHSLESRRLVAVFDLGAFSDLISNPDVAWGARMNESTTSVFVFFLFSLFLTGGILTTYNSEYKLTTGEFFQACGTLFWRWVRLFPFMLILVIAIALGGYELMRWSRTVIFDKGGKEMTGYWIGFAALILWAFLMMLVRLWFDMAQVRAVLEDERAMRRTLVRSFKLTFSNFGSLFWLYFRISFLAWLGLAIGLWLWAKIPSHRFGLSFLILELVMLWGIGTRLWQRASETIWYQRCVGAAASLSMDQVTSSEAPAVSLPPVATN